MPISYPPQVCCADWNGLRYYAVDYDGGNDVNLGYSDLSLASAGAVALKTLERLRQVLPRFGNGQRVVIGVKTRAGGAAYRNIANTADDNLSIVGVTGYAYFLIRGTADVPSGASVAFANDAADKVVCGAQLVPGTNAAGYNPLGVPTVNTFDCQLAGGGAPVLAAEPTLIGKRIRFDALTATAALRNQCRMIWQNDADTITVSANLPAVPALADVFYIEEPGVAVDRVQIQSSNQSDIQALPSFVGAGIELAGFRALDATQPAIQIRGNTAAVFGAFLDAPNSSGFSCVSTSDVLDLRIQNTYTDELAATITVGVGVRSGGGMTSSRHIQLIASHSAMIAARFQVLDVFTYQVGAGCYALMGALLQGCGQGTSPGSVLSSNILGRGTSTTVQRFRTAGAFLDSINLTRTHAVVYGIDITGVGALPCISVNAIGANISINDVVGSAGNTDVGLSLVLARDCALVMGVFAANTFTGTLGDIRGAGPVFYTHADLARTDLKDSQGNHIQGVAGALLGTTALAANNGIANIAQYSVVRATGSGVVQAAQADTAANAAGVVGVNQSFFTTVQASMLVPGGGTWIQFDAAPTAGAIAYLSDVTAGQARDTPPPLVATNQKLRLGRVLKVLGTLGFVGWHPESLSVLSDGLP